MEKNGSGGTSRQPLANSMGSSQRTVDLESYEKSLEMTTMDTGQRQKNGIMPGLAADEQVVWNALMDVLDGKTYQDAAREVRMSAKTISSWVKRANEQGVLRRTPDGRLAGLPTRGRQDFTGKSKLSLQAIERLVETFATDPTTSQLQMQEILKDEFGVDVSISTISRRMHQAGMRHMRAAMTDPKKRKGEERRAENDEFLEQQVVSGDVERPHDERILRMENIIAIDESNFNSARERYGMGTSKRPPLIEMEKGKTSNVNMILGVGAMSVNPCLATFNRRKHVPDALKERVLRQESEPFSNEFSSEDKAAFNRVLKNFYSFIESHGRDNIKWTKICEKNMHGSLVGCIFTARDSLKTTLVVDGEALLSEEVTLCPLKSDAPLEEQFRDKSTLLKMLLRTRFDVLCFEREVFLERLRQQTKSMYRYVRNEAKYFYKGGAHGLRWRYVGTKEPSTGKKLKNVALADALSRRSGSALVSFTQQEWEEFGIHNLDRDHCVQSGDSFFAPVDDDPSNEIVFSMNTPPFSRGVAVDETFTEAKTTWYLQQKSDLLFVKVPTSSSQGRVMIRGKFKKDPTKSFFMNLEIIDLTVPLESEQLPRCFEIVDNKTDETQQIKTIVDEVLKMVISYSRLAASDPSKQEDENSRIKEAVAFFEEHRELNITPQRKKYNSSHAKEACVGDLSIKCRAPWYDNSTVCIAQHRTTGLLYTVYCKGKYTNPLVSTLKVFSGMLVYGYEEDEFVPHITFDSDGFSKVLGQTKLDTTDEKKLTGSYSFLYPVLLGGTKVKKTDVQLLGRTCPSSHRGNTKLHFLVFQALGLEFSKAFSSDRHRKLKDRTPFLEVSHSSTPGGEYTFIDPSHLYFQLNNQEAYQMFTLLKRFVDDDASNNNDVDVVAVAFGEFLMKNDIVVNATKENDGISVVLDKLLTGPAGTNSVDQNVLANSDGYFQRALTSGPRGGTSGMYETRSTVSSFVRYLRNLCKYVHYTYGEDVARSTRLIVDNASTHMPRKVDSGKVSTLHRIVKNDFYPYNVYDVIFTPVRDPRNNACEFAFSKMKRQIASENKESIMSISKLMQAMDEAMSEISLENIIQFFRMGCYPLTSLGMFVDGQEVIRGFIKKNNKFYELKSMTYHESLPGTSFCKAKTKPFRNRVFELPKRDCIADAIESFDEENQKLIAGFYVHNDSGIVDLTNVDDLQMEAAYAIVNTTTKKCVNSYAESGHVDDEILEQALKVLSFVFDKVGSCSSKKLMASLYYFLFAEACTTDKDKQKCDVNGIRNKLFPTRLTGDGLLTYERDKHLRVLSCQESMEEVTCKKYFQLSAEVLALILKFESGKMGIGVSCFMMRNSCNIDDDTSKLLYALSDAVDACEGHLLSMEDLAVKEGFKCKSSLYKSDSSAVAPDEMDFRRTDPDVLRQKLQVDEWTTAPAGTSSEPSSGGMMTHYLVVKPLIELLTSQFQGYASSYQDLTNDISARAKQCFRRDQTSNCKDNLKEMLPLFLELVQISLYIVEHAREKLRDVQAEVKIFLNDSSVNTGNIPNQVGRLRARCEGILSSTPESKAVCNADAPPGHRPVVCVDPNGSLIMSADTGDTAWSVHRSTKASLTDIHASRFYAFPKLSAFTYRLTRTAVTGKSNDLRRYTGYANERIFKSIDANKLERVSREDNLVHFDFSDGSQKTARQVDVAQPAYVFVNVEPGKPYQVNKKNGSDVRTELRTTDVVELQFGSDDKIKIFNVTGASNDHWKQMKTGEDDGVGGKRAQAESMLLVLDPYTMVSGTKEEANPSQCTLTLTSEAKARTFYRVDVVRSIPDVKISLQMNVSRWRRIEKEFAMRVASTSQGLTDSVRKLVLKKVVLKEDESLERELSRTYKNKAVRDLLDKQTFISDLSSVFKIEISRTVFGTSWQASTESFSDVEQYNNDRLKQALTEALTKTLAELDEEKKSVPFSVSIESKIAECGDCSDIDMHHYVKIEVQEQGSSRDYYLRPNLTHLVPTSAGNYYMPVLETLIKTPSLDALLTDPTTSRIFTKELVSEMDARCRRLAILKRRDESSKASTSAASSNGSPASAVSSNRPPIYSFQANESDMWNMSDCYMSKITENGAYPFTIDWYGRTIRMIRPDQDAQKSQVPTKNHYTYTSFVGEKVELMKLPPHKHDNSILVGTNVRDYVVAGLGREPFIIPSAFLASLPTDPKITGARVEYYPTYSPQTVGKKIFKQPKDDELPTLPAEGERHRVGLWELFIIYHMSRIDLNVVRTVDISEELKRNGKLKKSVIEYLTIDDKSSSETDDDYKLSSAFIEKLLQQPKFSKRVMCLKIKTESEDATAVYVRTEKDNVTRMYQVNNESMKRRLEKMCSRKRYAEHYDTSFMENMDKKKTSSMEKSSKMTTLAFAVKMLKSKNAGE